MNQTISTHPLVDLCGKSGLFVGIVTDHSIAAGCVTAFRQAGTQLADNVNAKAAPFTRPVTDRLGCAFTMPYDVRVSGGLEKCVCADPIVGATPILPCIRSPSRRKWTCRAG